ncbi:hypothetical protein ACETF5_001878 [Yersinia enterocolitica]
MGELDNQERNINAAIDYRQQIQSRHNKDVIINKDILVRGCEHIRKVFPNSFDSDDLPIALLRDFFVERDIKESLSIQEIEKIINEEIKDEGHPLRVLFSDKDTVFDDFISTGATRDYVNEIERACERLGFDLRDGVTCGVTHEEIIQAEQQTVFLTDSSIINITSNLYILAHRASKLLAKSIAFEEVKGNQYRLSNDLNAYKRQLLENVELQRQWDFFFADHALNNKNPDIGEIVHVGDIHIQNCFFDMKEAMLLFVIGHEFGHHIAKHSSMEIGKQSPGDNFSMEHEADILASVLTMDIGRKSDDFNFFASANLGAFCILKILDFNSRAYDILIGNQNSGKKDHYNDHPPIIDRLGVMRAYIKNYEYDETSGNVILSLIDLFNDLMDFIWSNSSRFIHTMKESGVKSVEQNEKQWLP